MKLRHVLFNTDPKYKKQKQYADDESDLDDDWIEDHEKSLKNKEIEKAEKKFAKDNEKLVQEGNEPQPDSVLQEKIEAAEAEYKRVAKERGTGKAKLKRDRPPEKIEETVQKLDEKIKTFKLQMDDREAGKEVALGTRYVVLIFKRHVLTVSRSVKLITWTLGEFPTLHKSWIATHSVI
jgi:DNA topoisomerase-1